MFRAFIHDVISLIPSFARSYYGQEGEDAILARLLGPKRKGTYIDVGANHPVLYSNTYFFYQKGWRGILVEPVPRRKWMFDLLRPRDTFVPCAIGKKKGILPLYVQDQTQISSAKIKKGKRVDVPVVTLSDVCQKHGMWHVDFLSIDVEGFEMDVLTGVDWSRFEAKVICIEDHGLSLSKPASSIHSTLITQGYTLVCRTPSTSFYTH